MLKYIEHILLALLCSFRYIIWGAAIKSVQNPKRIVIVQLARLGDVVCATPLFHAVKKTYPDCLISVVGREMYRELLEGNDDVDEYLGWECSFYSFRKRLTCRSADFACITNPSFRGLAVLYLAGIPSVATHQVIGGRSPYETRLYKLISRFVFRIPHRMGAYAPREYLRLLVPAGIYSDDTKKRLGYSENARNSIRSFFANNGINEHSDTIIVLYPSAGNRIKVWDAQNFVAVAKYLIQQHKVRIIIDGSSNDRDAATAVWKELNPKAGAVLSAGHFRLNELKALIDAVHLVISVDSGPIYIAEAFGTPTVDIIGPMDEREQPPIGEIHRIAADLSRKEPALHIMNARDYDKKEARRQVDAITPEMVIREITALPRFRR